MAKEGRKQNKPRTTAFESKIGKPVQDGNDKIVAGQNPEEIAERAGTNVEFNA